MGSNKRLPFSVSGGVAGGVSGDFCGGDEGGGDGGTDKVDQVESLRNCFLLADFRLSILL
jgi:hypothetical protein